MKPELPVEMKAAERAALSQSDLSGADVLEQKTEVYRVGKPSGYVRLGSIKRMLGAEDAAPVLERIAEDQRRQAEALRHIGLGRLAVRG